jgi:hypothetical protein
MPDAKGGAAWLTDRLFGIAQTRLQKGNILKMDVIP